MTNFLTNDEDDKALIAEIENYLRLNFGFRIYDAQIYLFNANIGFYTRVSDNEIDYLVNAIFGERIKTVGKSYIYREVREFLRRESNLLVRILSFWLLEFGFSVINLSILFQGKCA